eukprot:11254712-Heterocapsa_arctica.AAC.1
MFAVIDDKVEKVMNSGRMADPTCVLTTSEYDWSASMIKQNPEKKCLEMFAEIADKKEDYNKFYE